MDYLELLEATAPDLVVVVTLFTVLGLDYGMFRDRDVRRRKRSVLHAWLFASPRDMP